MTLVPANSSGGGSSGSGGGPITAPLDGSGFVQVDVATGIAAGSNVIGSVTQSGSPWGVNPSAETAGVGVGAAADVKVTGDSAGSLIAKLRGLLYEVGDQADAAALTTSLMARLRQLGVLLNGGLPAALGAGGGLKVDGSGTTLPVSGTVTANAGSGTLAVSLASLPALAAGTALAGKVGAFPGTGQIIDSTGVARTVSSAFANVAASQTDSVIQALSGALTTYVFAVVCVAGATATNITFNSKPSGAGSAISPLFANAANGGVVLPFTGSPWFQSASSAGISVTTGAGSTTGVLILYAQF